MREELPQGWAKATLGELCSQPQYGWTTRSAKHGLIRYVRTTDISDGGIEWATVPFCEVAPEDFQKYAITPNDILVSRAGSVGVSIRVLNAPYDAVFASYLIRFKPFNGVSPEYVSCFLKSDDYWRSISEFAAGIAVPNVNASKLSSLELPLAPFEEQRRIVAELETLFSKVDDCKKRLTRIPTFIRRFRQSVLAAACSGRLTADWREEHPDIGTAHDLVLQIDNNRARGAQQKSGNHRPASKERVTILADAECPDRPIPESWAWVRFGSVIGELRNGVSRRPNIGPPGIPILRISASRPGSVDLADVRYMSKGKEFLPNYRVLDGDLLFTRYNGSIELLGVCGMVRGLGKSDLLYPDKLMRVRFDHDFILPAYAEIFFQDSEVHERIVAKSKSSAGQNGVSGSDIKAQPFALAPLIEQQEIVRRVAKHFALADRVESRYGVAKERIDSLTQSILAKAFRGELVPTEAELAEREGRSYESAEKLLQRIRATKPEKASTGRNRPNNRKHHVR